MSLPRLWMLESLKNLPLLLGFVVAARLWNGNWLAALGILFIGMALGVMVTRRVEPLMHREQYEMRRGNVIVNFTVFMLLGLAFVHYFRIESRWLNWMTDLAGGLVAALALTFAQKAVWRGQSARMFAHGLAMAVSFPLIMLGIRFAIQMDDWGGALLTSVGITLFASLLIALIDYREMYQLGG